ncbi:MAG: histidinol-phosphate transaminase [Alphaproteobacteria bacterium]|nr:histidinol-phosphate transaminase [Alphaproteobacteria bacterium]MDE1987683.1 histidinol-phosphate transaminase [Alphaproteobacteria bacterium]MDE2164274.1 histidinol-phosphate transaminase [Alphaproteobacteria bacterium]MDE2266897.1 histidinol-phosphate transaminase [Alphaproteobacteria bacterium]
MTPIPKPGVLDITPYVGGRASVGGVANPTKLSSNESALGPSPLALTAYEEAASEVAVYPEGSASILRAAIGETYGLDTSRIVCGNGSDELLTMLASAYLRPGDEVLFSEHAFIVYRIAALANSAVPVAVPEKNLCTDVDAMLARVTPKTRLVYLANPNNPTGSYLAHNEVRRLHAGLPPQALLVIDAAYAEFVRRNDFEPGIEMVANFPNVVMTRTFSKVYGLAGLRIGWAYCPAAVADVLNRIRGPFNVSIPAQRAGVAALKDRDHVERSVAHNMQWRMWLTEAIRATGLRVDDSVGNFILIHFPQTKGKTASDADRFLCERGLILRAVGNYGLPDCLRLTVGLEDANRKVAAALTDFMRRP